MSPLPDYQLIADLEYETGISDEPSRIAGLPIAQQTQPTGATTTVVKTYPVAGMDEEYCEICERVDKRANMHMAGLKHGEFEVYVCDAAHPKEVVG